VRLWRTAATATYTYIPVAPSDINSARAADEKQWVQDHSRSEAYGVPIRVLVWFDSYGPILSERQNRFAVDISIRDFLALAPCFGYLSEPRAQSDDEIRDELGLGPKW